MNSTIKIVAFLTILFGFISATKMTSHLEKKVDFGKMIENYLESKTIKPTVIFNSDGRTEFELLDHNFVWRELENGLEITIDGHSINTSDKVTSNPVWETGIDSVNFANFLQQVKVYESDSLIGFVLTNIPCIGLGCSVNYQIIYDLKTKKQSYFGRFQTGFEFELYDFNSDNRPDYLSKTCFCRNASGIDSTEFVLYSQSVNGIFEEFQNEDQQKFWFKHTYTEFQMDLNNEKFEENWTEKINKSNN